MSFYTDTHAHLRMCSAALNSDDSWLDELLRQDLGLVIDIGTKSDDLDERIARWGNRDKIFFSAGIWPSEEDFLHADARVAVLTEGVLRHRDRVCAIGEIGLDRYHNTDTALFAAEEELFRKQIELALELDLPIIVHSRDSAKDTIRILKSYPGLKAVVHCFSYSPEEAQQIAALDMYISFSGTITYKKADSQREAVRLVPSNRLLLETDAPYLAPHPLRGTVCTPELIKYTYDAVVKLRNIPLSELQELVSANTNTLFSLDNRGRTCFN